MKHPADPGLACLVRLGQRAGLPAEIKIGQRRMIDCLLSPLRQYQQETLRER
jgi:hypothetical protein